MNSATALILLGASQWPELEGAGSSEAFSNSALKVLTTLTTKPQGVVQPELVCNLFDSHEEYSSQISRMREFVDQALSDHSRLNLLVYFIGHGDYYISGDRQDYCLLIHNSRAGLEVATSINPSHVAQATAPVSRNEGNRFLIVDACYAAAAAVRFQSSVKGNADVFAEEFRTAGDAILCSSTAVERSLLDKSSKMTLFSKHFLAAIQRGDPNKGNYLSLRDVKNIMVDGIRSERKHSREKTPLPMPALYEPRQVSGQSPGDIGLFFNAAFRQAEEPQRKGAFDLSNEARKESLAARFSRDIEFPRLLVIKPKIDFPITRHDLGIPLGPYVLKSELGAAGFDVDVLDERLEAKGPRARSLESFIDDYDVIGISACTCEIPQAIRIARLAKDKGKKTVLGGIFAHTNEAWLLKTGIVDFVIPGVATEALRRLLTALRRNGGDKPWPRVVGVHTMHDKKHWPENVFERKPLQPDALPWIRLEEWDETLRVYRPFMRDKIDTLTARGCVYGCSFCSIQKETSNTYLTRAEEDVAEEIKHLVDQGFRQISIKDEIFPFARERDGAQRALTILRCVRKLIGVADVKYKIKSRVDILNDDRNLLRELAELGVGEIQFGVEAIERAMQRNVCKGGRLPEGQQLQEFLRGVASEGIVVNASFILGIQGDDERYYQNLIRFLEPLNDPEVFKIYVNFYTPHPQNGKFTIAQEGRLFNRNLRCFTHKIPVMAPGTLPRRSGREAMLRTYEAIQKLTNSKEYNPDIPQDFREQFLDGEKDYAGDQLTLGEVV